MAVDTLCKSKQLRHTGTGMNLHHDRVHRVRKELANMLGRLKRAYFRIGIHAAPPGTLLHSLHNRVFRVYLKALPLILRNIRASAAPERHFSWYKIVARRDAPNTNACHWRQVRAKLCHGEHIVYDLDSAIHRGGIAGIALVFFMGMGDYVFATPLLSELRRKYSDLPIYGYVSSTTDGNNSPLVARLMEHNPDIDKVFYYKGMQAFENWKNYDYDEVFDLVPPDFLVVPVLYECSPAVSHRMRTLFETFSLPQPKDIPLPLIHLPPSPSDHVLRLMNTIKKSCVDLDKKGLVFLQLDQRSRNYSYPYTDALAAGLCERGYFVVSASKTNYRNSACLELDLNKFSIIDSIYLLKLFRKDLAERLFLLTVTSVFWSLSAALEIPNLGIQHRYDDWVHNVWYPNTRIIAHYDYPAIPGHGIFLAGKAHFTMNSVGYADFKPEFVLQCFDKFSCIRAAPVRG